MRNQFSPKGQPDDLTKRIIELRTAIENNPADMERHSRLIKLLAQTGRTQEAIETGKHALTIDDHWRVRFYLTAAYIKNQQPHYALPHILKAIDLNPTISNSYALAGACYIQLDQFQEAETIMRQGLECGDEDIDFHLYSNLAFILMNTDRLQEAIELIEIGIEQSPNEVSTCINASSVYSKKGERERALELAEKAVELDPGNPLAQTNLQIVRVKAGLPAQDDGLNNPQS